MDTDEHRCPGSGVDSVYSVHSVVQTSEVLESETRKLGIGGRPRGRSTVAGSLVCLLCDPIETLPLFTQRATTLRVSTAWILRCAQNDKSGPGGRPTLASCSKIILSNVQDFSKLKCG